MGRSGIARACALLAACGWLLTGCRSGDLERGRACLVLGDYPMALDFFRRAVERKPESFEARLGLGQALLQKAAAEADSAAFAYGMVQLEACRSLSPTEDLAALLADAYTDRARTLLRRGDTARALASLARATERNPASVAPLNLAGTIYGRLGEPAKAEALFRKALALDSADASAHFNLGMIRWQAGDFGAAHRHWLVTLRAYPEDEDVLYWFALSEKKVREAP